MTANCDVTGTWIPDEEDGNRERNAVARMTVSADDITVGELFMFSGVDGVFQVVSVEHPKRDAHGNLEYMGAIACRWLHPRTMTDYGQHVQRIVE